MDEQDVINNWISRQKGFFITPSHIKCPICKKDVANKVITKQTGLCMHCFIFQIVSACKKLEPIEDPRISEIESKMDTTYAEAQTPPLSEAKTNTG